MPPELEIAPTNEDVVWALQFKSLHLLLKHCPNSEKSTLLLSTCRNAYMAINALFTELQTLLSDAAEPAALRGGAELLLDKEPDVNRLRERFGRSIQTIREYDLKRQVWAERLELWQEVRDAKDAISKFDSLAASTVDILLKNTRIPDQGLGDGFEHELLSIDFTDRQHLAHYFDTLDRQKSILGHAAHLGWGVALALGSKSRQPQLELGDIAEARTAEVALAGSKVIDAIHALAEACDWLIVRTLDGRAVQLSQNYIRPQNGVDRSQILLPTSDSTESIEAKAAEIGMLIREVLYFVHTNLSQHFNPNVARLPMPSLFSIDLPTSLHIQQNGISSPTEISRIRCSTRGEPKDSIRIGLAGLAVPFGKMNGQTYGLGADLTKKVTVDIRRAVESSRETKCDVVVFPEYSVPRSMIAELKTLADQHGVVIIGGLEGEWQHGKLYDQAVVLVPGEKHPYLQSKQEPSLEEESGDGFFRDGELKLFSNSPIGNFVVVVCSDFLQLATLRLWKDDAELPEVMFIVARNKYSELYENFAKTDAVRLYTCVAISNVYDESDETASTKGSSVVLPLRNDMNVRGEAVPVNGQFIDSLVAYDISLRAIRAKSRGKPDSGYLAVPKGAQRN